MIAEVLVASLGEFANYGFKLVEADDHILELYFKEKCIARFNQNKVTIATIQDGCKNYLANIVRSI